MPISACFHAFLSIESSKITIKIHSFGVQRENDDEDDDGIKRNIPCVCVMCAYIHEGRLLYIAFLSFAQQRNDIE